MKFVSLLGWIFATLTFAFMMHREVKHFAYKSYAEDFILRMDEKTLVSHELVMHTSSRYEECLSKNNTMGKQLYVMHKPSRTQTLKIMDWSNKRRIAWEKNEKPSILAHFSQSFKPSVILEKLATVFR